MIVRRGQGQCGRVFHNEGGYLQEEEGKGEELQATHYPLRGIPHRIVAH
jgi:hypothetical protein